MRLSTKVTVFIFSAAMLSTALVSFVTFQFTQTALEKVIGDGQLDLARNTMDKLDRFLADYYQSIEQISLQVKANPVSQDSRSLQAMVLATGPWQGFYYLNKEGNVVAVLNNSQPYDQVKAQADPLIKDAIMKQKIQYSDLSFEPQSLPTLLFAAPVNGDEVLLGSIAFDQIGEILNQLDDANVFLFNREQYLIASNQYELSIRLGVDQLDYDQLEAVFAGVSTIFTGNNLYQSISQYEGNAYQALLTAVPERGYKDFQGNGWALVIEKPTLLVFQSARLQAIQLVLLIVALLLIVAGIVLFLLRRYVTTPVIGLTRIARAINAGNLRARASVLTRDEIGELAQSFNNMTTRLARAYHLLSNRLKEIKKKNITLEQYSDDLHLAMRKLRSSKQEIAQAKGKVEAMLQSVGDGVIATNAQGKVIMINQQAATILKLNVTDVVGKEWSQVFTLVSEKGKVLAWEKVPLYQALEKKRTITTTRYSYRRQDNSILPAVITSAPMLQGDKLIGALDVFHDLTEEREIDQAKTEFVSLASHQLRMPLSIVNWYTEMLLSGDAGKLTPAQKEYLNEVYEGNQRMTNLVNTLLNVSRIETGKFIPSFRPTALDKVFHAAITELQPLIDHKSLNVEKRLGLVPMIDTDPGLIQILLQNLLSNAIKYTPTQGKITLRMRRDGKYILLEVSDTGYGIPAIEQKHIFTKLFRASNIKEKDTDGTGLGLYIAKAIVKQLKGKVWFESQEGRGTTFFVRLLCNACLKEEKKLVG
ncbi:MAG: HAMP domain-containing protein [Candidatus Abawacabacteria bacterium]|nr:HAMP domain-containing protein [Candidatus Abawacabacteria bacterium]